MKKLCLLAFLSVPASAQTLSFDQVREQILSRDPRLQSARAQRDLLQAKVLPDRFAMFPTLALEARHDWTGLDKGAPMTERFFGARGTLNLFRGGADFFALRSAQHTRQLAEFELADQEMQIEKEVLQDLFHYISQKQLLEIEHARLEIKKNLLKTTQIRFERGLIAAEEVEKLSLELSQNEALVSDSELSFLSAQSKLRSYELNAEMKTDWPWERLIANEDFLKQLPTDATVKRAQDLAVELSVEASEALRRRAASLMLPSLDLTSTYGRTQLSSSRTWDPQWIVGLTLSVPLFENFKSVGLYQQERAARDLAASKLVLKRREAQVDQEISFKTLERSRASALSRAKMLGRSKSLFEKSLSLFQSGRIRVNELSLDEERWLTSRTLAVQGWVAAHLALLSHCHAQNKRFNDCLLSKP